MRQIANTLGDIPTRLPELIHDPVAVLPRNAFVIGPARGSLRIGFAAHADRQEAEQQHSGNHPKNRLQHFDD